MLYTVMLVDDEKEVLEGMTQRVPWETLGFRIIAAAENGEDALEKMEAEEPDVILTDIRMPFMSGLDFITKVREKYPDKEIIIFSGYGEFEYAKKAMQLGVREYILKPVDSMELEKVMKKLRRDMDDEVCRRRNLEDIIERYRKTSEALKRSFCAEWLREGKNPDQVREFLEEQSEPERNITHYAACRIEPEAAEAGQDKNMELRVNKIFETVFGKRFGYGICTTGGVLGAVFYLTEDQTMDDLMEGLDRAVREAKHLNGIVLAIGAGSSRTNPEEIPVSFEEAGKALEKKTGGNEGGTFYIKDVMLRKQESSQEIIQRSIDYINEHISDPALSADAAAEHLGFTLSYFSFLFKKKTGQTWGHYLRCTRMKTAAELLKETDDKAYVISDKVGYNDSFYFSNVFKKTYGVSPQKFRKQYRQNA